MTEQEQYVAELARYWTLLKIETDKMTPDNIINKPTSEISTVYENCERYEKAAAAVWDKLYRDYELSSTQISEAVEKYKEVNPNFLTKEN